MHWYERQNGISVLIACQNEEALIALCIRSFLAFGDELIVVDNGSTDRSKEIIQSLQSLYPEKIKFFDVPALQTSTIIASMRLRNHLIAGLYAPILILLPIQTGSTTFVSFANFCSPRSGRCSRKSMAHRYLMSPETFGIQGD